MKKNNGFRVLSLVLSFALIFTVAGQMYTSAADDVPFKQVAENVDSDYITGMGSNLLSGKTPRLYATLNSNTKEVNEGDSTSADNYYTVCPPSTAWGGTSVMTDGEMFTKNNNKKNCQIQSTSYETSKQYGKYSVELIYDLENVYNIDKLLFVSWLATGTVDKRVQEYEFYISEDADTVDALFVDENKVTDIPTLRAHDENDASTAAQAFTASEAVSGRYVGIKLIKGSPENSKFQFIISELGVYGNKSVPFKQVEENVNSDYITGMGSNLLSGKTPKIYATLNETKEVIEGAKNSEENNHTVCPPTNAWGGTSVMTDGKIFTTSGNTMNCQIQSTAYKTNSYYGKYSVELIYDLEDVYNIDKLLFVSWLATGTDDKRVQEYEFYISENADTVNALFTDENRVTDIPTLRAHNATDPSTAAQAFTASKAVSGRYVGVKLKKGSPMNENFQFIINELGVYGKKQAVMYNYNGDDTVDIRDLVRLKQWETNSATEIDLSAKGEIDPSENSSGALGELRKHLLEI